MRRFLVVILILCGNLHFSTANSTTADTTAGTTGTIAGATAGTATGLLDSAIGSSFVGAIPGGAALQMGAGGIKA